MKDLPTDNIAQTEALAAEQEMLPKLANRRSGKKEEFYYYYDFTADAIDEIRRKLEKAVEKYNTSCRTKTLAD